MTSPGPYRRYEKSGDDLNQGDIILPDRSFKQAVGEIHPWLEDKRYNGFIVLTQTCDLAHRGGNPNKAKHLEIAPFRSLGPLVAGYADHVTGSKVVDGLYYEHDQPQVKAFVKRILNENETGHGLFYLPPDLGIGIGDHSAATLRVSFALRASEHYAAIQRCRRGGLKPPFEAKLGWMLGNLYGRPATPDWVPTNGNRESERELTENLVCGDLNWVAKAYVKQAKRIGIEYSKRPAHEAEELIKACKPPNALEGALSSVKEAVKRAQAGVQDETLSEIVKQLANDPVFTSILK